MLLNIIKQFNWVDILVVILLLRISYIGLKVGLPVEFFKFMGTLFAIYIPMHYYTLLSDWMAGRIPDVRDVLPLDFMDFLVFLILSVLVYLIFVLFRSVFYRFIKMETVPKLKKWGGLLLGAGRAFMLSGLIIFMLVISSIAYLKNSAKGSYSGRYLFQVAPTAYNLLWGAVASKFMANEKYNNTITEIEEGFTSR